MKKMTWFRLYTSILGALELVSNEKVGAALKAALLYFESGDVTIVDTMDAETRIVFGLLKQGADDSLNEYSNRVADGKRGAEIKKNKAEKELQARVKEMEKKYSHDDEDDWPTLPFS